MRASCFLCRRLACLFLAAITAADARNLDIDGESVCAIAYSPSTGDYHYGYGFRTRQEAEQAALQMCTAADSRIVCWVKGGFAALALGDDKAVWGVGWQYGNNTHSSQTGHMAIDQCAKQTTNCDVMFLLSSDGQFIYDRKKLPPPNSGSSNGGGGAPASATPRSAATPAGFISQMFSGEIPLPKPGQ